MKDTSRHVENQRKGFKVTGDFNVNYGKHRNKNYDIGCYFENYY